MTNRELYLVVANLEDQYSGKKLSLEQYLRSLWQQVANAQMYPYKTFSESKSASASISL